MGRAVEPVEQGPSPPLKPPRRLGLGETTESPTPLPWRPQPGSSGTGPAQVSRPFVPLEDARPWATAWPGLSLGQTQPLGLAKGSRLARAFREEAPAPGHPAPRPPLPGHLDLGRAKESQCLGFKAVQTFVVRRRRACLESGF